MLLSQGSSRCLPDPNIVREINVVCEINLKTCLSSQLKTACQQGLRIVNGHRVATEPGFCCYAGDVNRFDPEALRCDDSNYRSVSHLFVSGRSTRLVAK